MGFLSKLLSKPSAGAVAKALGKQMGATPSSAGDKHRVQGSWSGARCRVVLDGGSDEMSATVSTTARAPGWEIRWTKDDDEALSFVSTHVALSERDAALLEKLPMKVRLHVTEVVEAGRGRIRLEGGSFVMTVKPAGLARDNGAEQAAIRLDVLADLVKAANATWRG
jgi:hypothetical protein